MGRKKKVVEKEPEVAEYIVPEVVKTTILPLSVDFGREDLNTMGNKINELIEKLNGL